ncbi:hypothetical protein ACTFIZ_005722 [Dictyostelium cf. discoideum]
MTQTKEDTKNYDMKCEFHEENKYKFICVTCKVAMCKVCIISKDHCGHETDLITKDSIEPITKEFKDINFKSIQECSNKIKEYLEISNKKFSKIEKEHSKNENFVSNEFKKINKLLQKTENDKIKELSTHFNTNKEINTNISNLANKYLKNIDQIQNKSKDLKDFNVESFNDNDIDEDSNNSNNNINEKILGFLKHYHQTKIVLKEISSESEIDELLCRYENITIQISSDKFKSSIGTIINLKMESKDPNKVTVNGQNFYIYKEGYTVPNGTTNLALGPSIKNLNVGSIPATVTSVVLLNGFNFKLLNGILPSSLQLLYVGAIKKPLLVGSIPPGVTSLFLLDGFDQKISEIPQMVGYMYVDDIQTEGIPLRSNIQIYKSPSCKQQFNNSTYVHPWTGFKIIEEN